MAAKTTVLLNFGSGPSTVVGPTTAYIRAVAAFPSGNKVILPGPGPIALVDGQGTALLDGGIVWEFIISAPSYRTDTEYRYVPESANPIQYKDLLIVARPPANPEGAPDWALAVLAAVDEAQASADLIAASISGAADSATSASSSATAAFVSRNAAQAAAAEAVAPTAAMLASVDADEASAYRVQSDARLDSSIAGQINTTASATRGALDATIAAGIDGSLGHGAVFYDDISSHANGVLAGVVPILGPTWQGTGAEPPVVSGDWVTSSGTGYAYITLPEKPAVIWSTSKFEGSSADSTMTMAFCLTSGTTMLDNFLHFNYGAAGYLLTVRRDAEEPFPELIRGQWRVAVPTDGVAEGRFGLAVQGDVATIFGPNGEIFSVSDPRVGSLSGPTVFWEPRVVNGSSGYFKHPTASSGEPGGAEAGVASHQSLAGAGFAVDGRGRPVGNSGQSAEVTIGTDPTSRMPAIFFGSADLRSFLRSSAAIGATALSTENLFPPGTTLTIESGNAKETVVTGAYSSGSAAPYTTPLATALTKAHPAKSFVGGAPTSNAQTKMYLNPANGQFFLPNLPVLVAPGGKLYVGGLDAFIERVSSGVIGTRGGWKFATFTTALRPTGYTSSQEGTSIFDSTLKRPIWWDGTKWVDAMGSTV